MDSGGTCGTARRCPAWIHLFLTVAACATPDSPSSPAPDNPVRADRRGPFAHDGGGDDASAAGTGTDASRAAADPKDMAAYPKDVAAADAVALAHVDAQAAVPEPPQTRVAVLLIDINGAAVKQGVKTTGRLRVIEDHDGTLKNLAARPVALDTPIGISLHGNSSIRAPKKSYALELRDTAGADRDMRMLGLPPESDFVLYHCFLDATYVRNALTYALGRATGNWAPRTRFVEILIDGQYVGLYLAVEKIKRGRDRVPIPKVASDAATGDVTGGYILSREGPESPATNPLGVTRVFKSMSGQQWTYRYPNETDVTPEQKAYLQKFMDGIESRFKAADFADPATGYRKYLDAGSWVDLALLQEFSNNVDAYRKSAYFYKDSDTAGGRLHAGPLWDFDLAYGNPDVNWENQLRTDIWDWKRSGVPGFWPALWGDRGFQRDVKCRWTELRNGALAMPALRARVDDWVKLLTAAEARDHALWKPKRSWAMELAIMWTWIEQRLSWLDTNMPGQCPVGPLATQMRPVQTFSRLSPSSRFVALGPD